MKTSLDTYAHSHRHLPAHYAEGNYRNFYFLLFTREWMVEHLPKDMTQDALDVLLLDDSDGKVYRAKHFAALSETYDEHGTWSLNRYVYEDHYCACHRKTDARRAGADTDDECDGFRFQVLSVESPNLPGLTLYTERPPRNMVVATHRAFGGPTYNVGVV